MDEPKSLDSLFKEKIFRIPDYQRGYAWQREQLKAFWEDLLNLPAERAHYTGVLTLKEIPAREISEQDKEFWLVDDHSYRVYHIVDGQQRLTTFIIFLQAFVDFVKTLPDNSGKSEEDIFIGESLNLSSLKSRYLFKSKPTGDKFRTYKFGYTSDNPSYNYLRFKILGEEGSGSVQETFYTLNLNNAKIYFSEQLDELYKNDGLDGLQNIYRKATKRFLFNEYIIKDEFDVFVAFETMNNRGKKLSDLELLKNRLIYLTTLYSDKEVDAASRKNLRDVINDAWKEVYHQLGRNKSHPLNDDDFLHAHWIMYFKYSRKTGSDYIRFLLDEHFTPQKVHKKTEREVVLEKSEENNSAADSVDFDDTEPSEEIKIIEYAQLEPTEISDFVSSLKVSAVHWFNSFYPGLADGMSELERLWIDRLNRIGMMYFRPLIMAILKNEADAESRINTFIKIERFIFIVFRVNSAKSNYGSSEFYNAARAVDRKEIGSYKIGKKVEEFIDYTFNDDGTFSADDFHYVLNKKFEKESGYYGWGGLRYFLYEYELSLLSQSRQKKIDWSDLTKTEKDKISIEHIYPQTETEGWSEKFSAISQKNRIYYRATLGNLLLLSASINSSLQNDNFEDKKNPKYNALKSKVRNGYSDGSHSEIEVSQNDIWGPDQILERGIRLLSFMEKRWDLQFGSEAEKIKLLFLDRCLPADAQ